MAFKSCSYVKITVVLHYSINLIHATVNTAILLVDYMNRGKLNSSHNIECNFDTSWEL